MPSFARFRRDRAPPVIGATPSLASRMRHQKLLGQEMLRLAGMMSVGTAGHIH